MTTLAERPSTVQYPVPSIAAATPRRSRSRVWPYAGLVSGLTGAAASMVISATKEVFDRKGDDNVSNDFLITHLNSAVAQYVGAGLAFVSVVAGLVFLIGLTDFVGHFAPQRHNLLTAVRWASAALLGTASIGASMRYISAGGHPDGLDHLGYTDEAIGTISVLTDQLAYATYLPALVVMGAVGLLAIKDRVFPKAVGIAAVVLAGASTAATLAVGLPYSSALVYPLFALMIGVAGIASRKAH